LPATVCALAVCLALGFAAAAWVEPNGIPPADNVVAPINTGGEAQYKTGGLGVKIGGAVTYWISQIGDKLAFKTGNDFARRGNGEHQHRRPDRQRCRAD